jgi:hypothetical protein
MRDSCSYTGDLIDWQMIGGEDEGLRQSARAAPVSSPRMASALVTTAAASSRPSSHRVFSPPPPAWRREEEEGESWEERRRSEKRGEGESNEGNTRQKKLWPSLGSPLPRNEKLGGATRNCVTAAADRWEQRQTIILLLQISLATLNSLNYLRIFSAQCKSVLNHALNFLLCMLPSGCMDAW